MAKQRFFYPGSEWVFYKLYCGIKGADNILLNEVYKTVHYLTKKNFINKWFFVRYYDPDYHLRIRFHATSTEFLPSIISFMYKSINHLVEEKLIWKIQIDTYERELERYNSIEKSEEIFHIDSVMNLNILKITNNRSDLKWKIAVKIMGLYLSFLDLSIEKKVIILNNLSTSFKKEFGFNDYNSKSLNVAYREYKHVLDDIIQNKYREKDYIKCINIVKQSKKEFLPYINLGTINYLELANYIHMSFNRLFISSGKHHEMLLYHFLEKYYRSEIVKKKNIALL